MGEKEQLYDWMLVLTSPMAFNRVRTCDLFTILCTHTHTHTRTHVHMYDIIESIVGLMIT